MLVAGHNVPSRPVPSLSAAARAQQDSRTLVLSGEERAALEAILLHRKPGTALVRRARIVLACAEAGAASSDVAEALGISSVEVVTWRTLFHRHRLAALPGSARPQAQPKQPSLDQAIVERVLRLTRERASVGGKPWSTRELAKIVGISHVRAWEIWRAHRIVPKLVPGFAGRARRDKAAACAAPSS